MLAEMQIELKRNLAQGLPLQDAIDRARSAGYVSKHLRRVVVYNDTMHCPANAILCSDNVVILDSGLVSTPEGYQVRYR